MKTKLPLIILGQNGMLGQMAMVYFQEIGYEIIINPFRFEEDSKWKFIEFNRSYPGAVIINAIGKIKQKTSDISELLWANSILPVFLLENLLGNQLLVNPSTDCVYNAKKGQPYSINDRMDATDAYGWSKVLADVVLLNKKNVLIPRVSIIGPDRNKEPKGLLGWFLTQKEGTVLNGFTNHLWNGITTLEWCKQIESIIKSKDLDIYTGKPVQIGTQNAYTKYEMLKMFAECFNKKIKINELQTEEPIDRRLLPEIITRPLEEQLIELKKYM